MGRGQGKLAGVATHGTQEAGTRTPCARHGYSTLWLSIYGSPCQHGRPQARVLEEGLRPALRQLERLLVGGAQRVDVLPNALHSGRAAAKVPGGSHRAAFGDRCDAALRRLPRTAALLRSDRRRDAARLLAQAVQAS